MLTACLVLLSVTAQQAAAQDLSYNVPFTVEGKGQEYDPLGTSLYSKMEAMRKAAVAARAQIEQLAASHAGPGIHIEIVELSVNYETKWIFHNRNWYSTCTIDGYLIVSEKGLIDFLQFLSEL